MKTILFKLKKVYKKYGLFAALTVLFVISIYYMLHSTEQAYLVPRELFFYRGTTFFLIAVFLFHKKAYKNFVFWAIIALGVIALTIYFNVGKILPSTYGMDLFKVIAYKHFLIVLTIALFIDQAIVWKKRRSIGSFNPIMTIIIITAIFVAAIMDRSTIVPFGLISFTVITTDIEEKEWVKLVDSFAIGYYLVFVWMMTSSLLFYRDNLENGRMIGAFLQVETAGMFCGGAFLCVLYLFIKLIYSQRKKWYEYLIVFVLMLYPLLSLVLISSRSSIFGLAAAIMGAFIFLHGKKNHKLTIKRAVIAILAICLALGILVGLSVFLNSRSVIQEIDLSNSFNFLLYKLAILTYPNLDHGYFDSPFWNAIDCFSSKRIRIWAESVKHIGFVGQYYQSIMVNGKPIATSPHNFYILALISYGWLGGGLVIAWFVYYLVLAVKRSIERDKNVILSALWVFFCIANFMVTCETWASPVYFGLLLLQYPLIRFNVKKRLVIGEIHDEEDK